MIQLDIRGQVCPNATGSVFAKLRQLPAGETLEVTSDYPPARTTIPTLAAQTGATCSIREGDGNDFVVVIRTADMTPSA